MENKPDIMQHVLKCSKFPFSVNNQNEFLGRFPSECSRLRKQVLKSETVKIQHSSHTVHLHVFLMISEQTACPYIALTDWVLLQPASSVFTARYELNLHM